MFNECKRCWIIKTVSISASAFEKSVIRGNYHFAVAFFNFSLYQLLWCLFSTVNMTSHHHTDPADPQLFSKAIHLGFVGIMTLWLMVFFLTCTAYVGQREAGQEYSEILSHHATSSLCFVLANRHKMSPFVLVLAVYFLLSFSLTRSILCSRKTEALEDPENIPNVSYLPIMELIQ